MGTLVDTTYWKWEAALSKEFCESSLSQIDWGIAKEGSIGGADGNQVVDPTYRITDVIWQNFMQPLGCIARRYMEEANHSSGWGYSLAGQEDTQIGRYKSSDKGFYDWHMDAAPPQNGLQRKLSCVILLNDASEFEGGVLQFKGMEDEIVLEKRGSVVVFPSFIEHRVTPVTKGFRYTAVAWAFGPSFR